MNHDKYMKYAILEAKKAYMNGEVPIGAIIVKNDKIISRAYNNKEKGKCCICHAEMIAIEKASKKLDNWRLDECVLYVTLEPCPMCASAIQQSRIGNVVFGAKSENANNFEIINSILTSNYSNASVSITDGILENECSTIIKDFFNNRR